MSMQRRKFLLNNAAIALIALSFVLTFFTPRSVALFGLDFTDNSFQVEMSKDILKGIGDKIEKALDEGDPVRRVAVGVYNDDGTWSDPGLTGITEVFTTFKMIAGLWCMAVALARLIQNIDKGIDPFEAIFKSLVEICIVGIFIMYLERIVGIAIQMGIWVTKFVNEKLAGGVLPGEEADVEACEEFLEKVTGEKTRTMGWRMETTIMLFLPWLFSQVLGLCAQLAIYQILIEIAIRRLFTPLAIGDIYQEGLRSPGVRYLKKILGAVLKLAVVAVVGALATQLTEAISVDEGGLSFVMSIIAVNLTCVFVMFKGGEYTNDIVGV